ncbi:MAG: transposase [Verrucomicrobiota bacterium]
MRQQVRVILRQPVQFRRTAEVESPVQSFVRVFLLEQGAGADALEDVLPLPVGGGTMMHPLAQHPPANLRADRPPPVRRHQRCHLPQSSMGKAISYALHLWPQLEVYLHDGRIGIDNNPVENAIRPTAVGKKNWLFIGEARAGQRSAILYTLIESCRTHHLDPFEYLRTILTLLPDLTTGQINRQSHRILGSGDGRPQRTLPVVEHR